jgi:hypothetical protein
MADIDLTAHPAIKEGATAFPRSQSAPTAFNLDLSPPPSRLRAPQRAFIAAGRVNLFILILL